MCMRTTISALLSSCKHWFIDLIQQNAQRTWLVVIFPSAFMFTSRHEHVNNNIDTATGQTSIEIGVLGIITHSKGLKYIHLQCTISKRQSSSVFWCIAVANAQIDHALIFCTLLVRQFSNLQPRVLNTHSNVCPSFRLHLRLRKVAFSMVAFFRSKNDFIEMVHVWGTINNVTYATLDTFWWSQAVERINAFCVHFTH